MRIADRLSLMAAPTFAVMALLTAVLGGPVDPLCMSTHGSAFGGMAAMYALMAAFIPHPG